MIELGKTYTLNKDIVFSHKIFGKKGEKVKVISISGNAVIFEKENGKRKPCNIKDLN